MLICRVCGHQAPEDARDCENCLQPLPRRAAVRDQTDAAEIGDPRPGDVSDGDPFAGGPSAAGPPAAVCLMVLDSVVVANPAEGEAITLGRDVGVEGLVWDDNVSRAHARVTRSKGVLEIGDCGSTNGTFVNGVRLRSGEIIPLAVGDVVEFAQSPPTRLIARSNHDPQRDLGRVPNGS